ncbi:hypothetical protein BGX29_005256, partial [Mortierella sp. GBA35]
MIDEMTESYLYRVMETELTDLEGPSAMLENQEPSHDDEQDHEQDLAQDDQQGDQQDDGDQYGGNSQEEGQEIDDTIHHELRQLAYQDILSMLAQDNVEAVYRI